MAAAVIDIHPDIRVVQNQAQRQIRFISTLQQYVLTSATGRPGVGRDHFLRQGVHQYFLPVIPVKTLIQIGIYPVYRQISLAVFVNPPAKGPEIRLLAAIFFSSSHPPVFYSCLYISIINIASISHLIRGLLNFFLRFFISYCSHGAVPRGVLLFAARRFLAGCGQ